MTIIWKHQNLVGLTVEKETEFPHPTVEGLRLRAYPNGRKSWVWQRMIDGKRRKKTLGRFPAIQMMEAQHEGDKLNQMAEAGIEPVTVTVAVAETERMTVSEAWAKYLEDCERRGVRSLHDRRMEGDKDIIPVVGDKFVADVTSDDIRTIVSRPLKRGRKLTGDKARTGGAHKSNAVGVLCRMFFKFCIENAYDDALRNPAMAVKPIKVVGSRKQRVLSVREMALLILAAREFDARNEGKTTWADIITLVCLNGNRKSEVMNAKCAHWDGVTGIWSIPPSNYKTGVWAEFPVSETSRAIFERRAKGDGFMIPYQTGVRTGQDTHVRKALHAIMEEIEGGPIPEWSFHATRYGLRSGMRKTGCGDSEVAERIIHPSKKAEMAAHYDPDWFDEIKEALAKWDSRLNAEIREVLAGRMAAVA